jgi:hypothetical protein
MMFVFIQAEDRETAWYDLLPLAAAAIAKKTLGLKVKGPEFNKFEDVMALYQKAS